MKVFGVLGAMISTAVVLAGCSVSMGGITPTSATPTPPLAAEPAPVSYGAFLEGSAGSRLSQADRDKALASEQGALASGQRETWKGEHGVYGYVEPAAGDVASAPSAGTASPSPSPGDSCRAFTSTIYLGGRPQVGHGRGCQNPDGTYRIVS